MFLMEQSTSSVIQLKNANKQTRAHSQPWTYGPLPFLVGSQTKHKTGLVCFCSIRPSTESTEGERDANRQPPVVVGP